MKKGDKVPAEHCPECGEKMRHTHSEWRYKKHDMYERRWACRVCGYRMAATYYVDQGQGNEMTEIGRRDLERIDPAALLKPRKKQANPNREVSICFDCRNAAGPNMCSWARRFVPVTGWDAEFRLVNGHPNPIASYWVKGCPLFERDRRRR